MNKNRADGGDEGVAEIILVIARKGEDENIPALFQKKPQKVKEIIIKNKNIFFYRKDQKSVMKEENMK